LKFQFIGEKSKLYRISLGRNLSSSKMALVAPEFEFENST